MSAIPLRSNAVDEGRRERLDAQLQDLERRLGELQLEHERLRAVEQTLLHASTERIHDFERRLEHEWLALRQLHEEPLKAFEQRKTEISSLVRHSRVFPIAALAAIVALTAFSAHTRWRLGNDINETAARAAAAEARVSELQARVERQTKETQQTVQRLTADAQTSATRAERLANVLAASDVRVYPLRGQHAAAAAIGQIYYSATRGIALTGSRLPLTPSNQTYQVWLTTSRGPISLGFATPDGQGRISGAYDTPPELTGTVLGFMLSTEPVGGNLRPTGPIALAS